MKKLILITLLSIASSIYAQDTLTYHVNGSGKKVSKEVSKYLRKVVKTEEGTYKVWDYYENGQLQMTGTYLNDSLKKGTGSFIKYYKNGNIEASWTDVKGKSTGKSKKYFESGTLKSSIDMVQDKKHGQLITYWDNGSKKREEKYINGNFVDGTCFNNTGNKIDFFPYEIMPEFPGGQAALFQFLAKNIHYPTLAKQNNIQGKSYINFFITKEGNISKAYVIKESHPLLDAEALRVINSMPKWTPGQQDGELISVQYNLPINFKLSNGKTLNLESIKYYKKGTRFMNNENYKKAISYFTTSINSDPKNKNAYYNRGLCYAKSLDMEKACLDWNKCAELGDKEALITIDKYCK